jgi:aspartyl aminopeptidase
VRRGAPAGSARLTVTFFIGADMPRRTWRRTLVLAALLLAAPPTTGAVAQEAIAPAQSSPGPVWPALSPAERDEVMTFGEDFKAFMAKARSEMTFVHEATRIAEKNGFRKWPGAVPKADLKPGSRWYAVNRDRTIVLFVIGRQKVTSGTRIVNAHIDAVRIELKPKPLRTSFDVEMLDTQVHGGLKNYQWVNRPLALIGRIDKTDGTTIWVDIGSDPADPVLLIPDLAPHVDKDYRDRKNRDVIGTEELKPILAMTAEGALEALKAKYGVTPSDLLSADLQVVPAVMPRDVGLDRQLVAAYGDDDRLSGYASLRAITEVGVPEKTAIAYCVNNEEVASWDTGVQSQWFGTLMAEVISSQESGYSDLMLRHAFARSQALESDCTTALNPLFPSPQDAHQSARLGWGLVVKEYGSGRQALSEYFARVRGILDGAGVRWQTHSYKAGYGGGTIAQWFANANIDVIDVGVGILSMHSPYDVSSKADTWELYRGFKAFFAAP